MDTCILNRYLNDDKQSLGVLVVIKNDLWVAKTLELGWKNNQNSISCIPVGEYICKYTRSNRLSQLTKRDYFTYEVLDVPGRSGIRIHSANYYNQLLGCIALGNALKDLNADTNLDLVHSGATVKAFENVMALQDFELIIK